MLAGFQGVACLSAELLFCSSLEVGVRITRSDPLLRHSRQALACSGWWVRTRATGRRTHWVHLPSYLRNWPDLVLLAVFGHSEKHSTIFLARVLEIMLGAVAHIWGRNPWLLHTKETICILINRPYLTAERAVVCDRAIMDLRASR